MNNILKAENDLKQEMKDGLSVPAVLKAQLIYLRSSDPDLIVLAFEGPDDKDVYDCWIGKIAPNLDYEPFVCEGKSPLLDFRKSLSRDRNNLGNGVYFFIDKDFDGLRGHTESNNIFITDTYSFENLLVTANVLDNLMKVDLNCHGARECRRSVAALFDKIYVEFLECTKQLNRRYFYAKRLNIEVLDLPERAGYLANITLSKISHATPPPETRLLLAREPTQEEMNILDPIFDKLIPKNSYRGKFALRFFKNWLDHLIKDRNCTESEYFKGLVTDRPASNSITVSKLARWSDLPSGLPEFISSMVGPRTHMNA